MASTAELRCPIDGDLAGLRRRVHAYATTAGLTGTRLIDLLLAVNEAATNVLDHGAGTGTLHARHDGHAITVRITDPAGKLTADHLNHVRDPNRPGGFGLSIINAVCDQVLLDHPQGQSRLTLSVRLPAADDTLSR
ncbi:ATP-binding protein [Nonomuraea gerenzanensis]|uniref:ATP-binding region, ATPase domain protein domain protein n=1 Tax=Nonomuraea gerenzanensis TaxID=93944 RepID=A0A1M4EEW6_9ACTN|nr:ATP-binding protein [Nonomuraea gerenzanensis]UBU08758.1 ATP-binding protein [Nonomuraea gerenzanensis]SBO97123.1 ATP-binding region, ATPase domain protein domain protein [Nonomuraea gerenzanensis]